MNCLTRRSFFRTSAAGLFSGALAGSMTGNKFGALTSEASAETYKGTLKKSMYWGMLPETLSVSERFGLAKKINIEGVEIPTLEDSDSVDEFNEASKAAGIKIHSIMNMKHWKFPFSSSDPGTVKTGMKGMETSLHNAHDLGADTVLLVPAVVNADTSYKDAYVRSQQYIREMLPLAKELGVVIAIENVWNKFLLSPLEFARYVDEIDSPYLKAYFDVGNIVLYGFPQDWIRTLGKRIVKVHIKGFDAKERTFTNILDGTIDWLEVRRALSETEYSGYINAELNKGDEAYLQDVSERMDRIITGKS